MSSCQQATKSRRVLDIEKEATGSAEVAQRIEEKQAKAEKVEKVLAKQNRAFYCSLCKKQCM